MTAPDQERELEATLARLAGRAVPDDAPVPAPPWQTPRRSGDLRRFGRATPWLVAAVLLVLAGLGIGAGVAFDASGPDRGPVATEPPGPSATATASDGTLGDAPTTGVTPSAGPSLDRDGNTAGPNGDGAASTAASSPPPDDVAVYANCNYPDNDAPAVRPAAIGLACADNGANLIDVTWSSWTASGATGSGTLVYRTSCNPDCASGSVYARGTVAVTLSEAVVGADGTTVWSRLVVSPALIADGTYSLPTRP